MRLQNLAVVAAIAGTLMLAGPPPAAQAQSFLKRLEQNFLRDAPVPREGLQGEPGYLGLTAEDDAARPGSVVIAEVRSPGPAADAGLRPGDRLVSIDGLAISRLEDLDQVMATSRPGAVLRFQIERGEAAQEIEVTLAAPPRVPDELPPPATAPRAQPGAPASVFERPSLGVTVTTVTSAQRQRYGLSVRSGALVTSVRPDSTAAAASIPVGSVIVAINGVRIDTSDELVAYVRGQRVGDELDISFFDGPNMRRSRVALGGVPAVAGEVPADPPPARAGLSPAPRVPAPDRPGDEPALRFGPTADLPVLRKLEDALGGLIDSRPPVPSASAAEVEALKNAIRALEEQVVELERRLKALEADKQPD